MQVEESAGQSINNELLSINAPTIHPFSKAEQKQPPHVIASFAHIRAHLFELTVTGGLRMAPKQLKKQ